MPRSPTSSIIRMISPMPSMVAPDAASLQVELEAAIDAAINQLPEQQRLAVILRRYEDLAYEEIAEVLKTSVPAVKSLLFRARTELRESLRGYLEISRVLELRNSHAVSCHALGNSGFLSFSPLSPS